MHFLLTFVVRARGAATLDTYWQASTEELEYIYYAQGHCFCMCVLRDTAFHISSWQRTQHPVRKVLFGTITFSIVSHKLQPPIYTCASKNQVAGAWMCVPNKYNPCIFKLLK